MKEISIHEALGLIASQSTIVTAMAASEPYQFFSNIHSVADKLEYVDVFCANPSENFPIFATNDTWIDRVHILVMFVTAIVRNDQGHKRIHYIPQHLSRWSENILNRGKVDIFWGSCSSPDDDGFVSIGPSNCYESEMVQNADIVILEENPNIPITYGNTTVSINDIDYIIKSNHPLQCFSSKVPTEIDKKIGSYITDLIPDESTLQLGIGGIPNALGTLLNEKKNLGIHTEMINDAMMNLIQSGSITNGKKSIHKNVSIASFVFGSSELYRFVHQKKDIELLPSSYVNNPETMGQNNIMISINSAVEVDITGQVCSESLGHRELSGIGGAWETHVGAQRSNNGKGIVALHSLTKDSKSKIVFELRPGAKVSISRNDIDTIVTEFGVASLRGKSVSDRAKAIINLAHPKFRDRLTSLAMKYSYL